MVCQCPLAGVCVCVCVWHYSREDNRCDFEKGTKKTKKLFLFPTVLLLRGGITMV